MTSKNILILIPARYQSSRFPGKPLAPIAGKTMIQRVYENCQRAEETEIAKKEGLSIHVGVVTDNDKIEEHVKSFNGNVYRVDDDVPSGSERIYLAYKRYFEEKERVDLLINVQGDEPLLNPKRVSNLAAFHLHSTFDVATMVKPMIGSVDRWKCPNSVKTIFVKQSNKCLYFSRAPIPFKRSNGKPDDLKEAMEESSLLWHLHIGVYSYKLGGLRSFNEMDSSYYENSEQLEQLRALEMGLEIGAIEVNDNLVGVDTPEDIQRVEGLILDKET